MPFHTTAGPGLQFVVNVTASAGEILDVLIGYSIAGGTFTGNILSMAGATATGDGVVTVIEDKCLGGNFDPTSPIGCTGTAANLIVFLLEVGGLPEGSTVEHLTFAPVAFIDLFVDIAVDGGPTGSAALASVTTQFVPEPASLGLLVVGLVSLGVCYRRFRHV
jgi:hypothetical protein